MGMQFLQYVDDALSFISFFWFRKNHLLLQTLSKLPKLRLMQKHIFFFPLEFTNRKAFSLMIVEFLPFPLSCLFSPLFLLFSVTKRIFLIQAVEF